MAYQHNGNNRTGPISGRQLYQAQKQSERGNTLGLILLGWVNRQRRMIQRTAAMSDSFNQFKNSTAPSHDQEDNSD